MPGFSLRTNTVFEWSGAACRIDRIQPNGELLVERLDEGRMVVIKKERLLSGFAKGEVRAVVHEQERGTNVPVYGRPLEDLSDRVVSEVNRRKHYLQAVLAHGKPVFTKRYLTPLLKEAAAALNAPKPPGLTSFYRWYRKYRQHKNFRCLAPRWDRRGSKNPKQAERILDLLLQSVEDAYKASPAASTSSIHARLCAKIDRENQSTLNGVPLVAPNLRTVYRLIQRADVIDLCRAKFGRAVADKRFRLATGTGVQVSQILERVEIDHTPLDLFLVDEKTGALLGRPLLTVVIDHYSRMILGYYLSFGHPSAAAVVGALRHAILPKEKAVEVVPNLPFVHQWECYGMPQVLVLDNGLEFLGQTLESIAFDLGFRLQFCPKHEPRFKGVVERYLKTVNYHFAALLPGASMAKLHLREDYDPQKMAVLPFGAFKHLFEKWVLDVYAQREHKSLRTSPGRQWQEGRERCEPELPPSVESLKRRIGMVSERRLQRNGITLHGIRYSSQELQDVAGSYGLKVALRVVFDPEDLGEIHVWKPDDDEPFTVAAVDQAAVRGRTLYQQQQLLQELTARNASVDDPHAAQTALGSILEAANELVASKKQTHRSKAARLLGVSSSKAQEQAVQNAERMLAAPTVRPLPKNAGAQRNGLLPPALDAFEMKLPKRGTN